VLAVEEMQAHRFGPYFVINVTIAVDGSVTVAEGDAISALLESVLHQDIDLLQRVHSSFTTAVRGEQGSPPGIANT